MATHKKVVKEVDDYGVEVFENTEVKQSKEEETKQQPKPEPQQLDEDYLYEQAPDVVVGPKTQQKQIVKEETKQITAEAAEDEDAYE